MTNNIALRVIEAAKGMIGVHYALYLKPRRRQYPADGLSCFALVCCAFESENVMLPDGLRRVRDLEIYDVGRRIAAIDALALGSYTFLGARRILNGH